MKGLWGAYILGGGRQNEVLQLGVLHVAPRQPLGILRDLERPHPRRMHVPMVVHIMVPCMQRDVLRISQTPVMPILPMT